MTREQAIREREAFNAFCDGKTIEEKGPCEQWEVTEQPVWACTIEHRVKQMPPVCAEYVGNGRTNCSRCEHDRECHVKKEAQS